MVASRVEDSYRRLHPRLWHALLAYSGDAEIANDAEADAFGQALRRGDGIADVDAWVWRTAFRVAAGLLKERSRRSLFSGLDRRPDEHLAVDEPSAVEFLSQLGQLTEQQRAIVALRYLGNFRSTEIAELLSTTPSTVRVQLHRAHKQLRTVVEHGDG